MDGLNDGLSISIAGELRDSALAECRNQIAAWNLSMPDVEPLVLDFGLNDYRRVGLIEYWIANEFQAGYCGKYLFLFDGQTCPMHHHKFKHETFHLVKGQLRVTYDGREFIMNPGDTMAIDTWKDHTFTGIGAALLLEISMPCEVEDNYFAEPSIPIGGNYREGSAAK